ncbi:MAG: ribosomal-processing cysteine protease Prp [Lachnospiraceae bacterium]|jgi:uncharacterized protein YsxB (DUF464 family)|nr:ribosomal-processing cysteine protease Prp [Lachnospiraceae bacterium]
MITIEIHKNGEQYKGFTSQGHAGYADSGQDIICAAVSVLAVNAINSIEAFTKDRFAVRQEDGFLELILEGKVSKEATLLLDSMILGLQDIQNSYGNEYIKLIYEEV